MFTSFMRFSLGFSCSCPSNAQPSLAFSFLCCSSLFFLFIVLFFFLLSHFLLLLPFRICIHTNTYSMWCLALTFSLFAETILVGKVFIWTRALCHTYISEEVFAVRTLTYATKRHIHVSRMTKERSSKNIRIFSRIWVEKTKQHHKKNTSNFRLYSAWRYEQRR